MSIRNRIVLLLFCAVCLGFHTYESVASDDVCQLTEPWLLYLDSVAVDGQAVDQTDLHFLEHVGWSTIASFGPRGGGAVLNFAYETDEEVDDRIFMVKEAE